MKRLAPIAAALLSLLLYVVVFAQDFEGTVSKGANLRSGPGTTYAIVGKATQGEAVTITDKNAAGDWYQLDTGEWIAAFLVTLDATPGATATPKATTMPTKQITQAEIHSDPIAQTYIAGIVEATDFFSTGATVIGERFTAASTNPSLIFTDRWKLAVAGALVNLQISSETLRTLEPPVYFSGVHDDILEMADHIDNTVVFVTEGIDELDADKLTLGVTEMSLVSQFANSAQAKMEAIMAAAAAAPTPTKTSTPRPTATKTPVPTATRKG